MNTDRKDWKYEEAYQRLKEIVSQMEADEVTVDQISKYLKEAVELLAVCKERLYTTEKDVENILASLEENKVGDNN